MSDIYGFVYRGLLTEVAIDKVRKSIKNDIIDVLDIEGIQRSLNFELLEKDKLQDAQLMANVYIALHALENTIRDFVIKQISEEFGETWEDKIPQKIKKQAEARKATEGKFRWHTRREHDYMYWQFGDLSQIVISNWDTFKDILPNQHWVSNILDNLEISRNVIMHGGVLERIDIERIGMSIRDWIRQVG